MLLSRCVLSVAHAVSEKLLKYSHVVLHSNEALKLLASKIKSYVLGHPLS